MQNILKFNPLLGDASNTKLHPGSKPTSVAEGTNSAEINASISPDGRLITWQAASSLRAVAREQDIRHAIELDLVLHRKALKALPDIEEIPAHGLPIVSTVLEPMRWLPAACGSKRGLTMKAEVCTG